MREDLFILLPSLEASGPVKGAIATANLLKDEYHVTLVTLKHSKKNHINHKALSDIETLSLANECWLKKFIIYKNLLTESQSRHNKPPLSLSLCFSADFFNAFFFAYAINISSIRNNIFKDYRFLYGYAGYLVALTHLIALNFFRKVYVMTKSMSEVIEKYLIKKPLIIPNFIDEQHLSKYRKTKSNSSTIKLIFVGTLTQRKQPVLLLESFNELVKSNLDINLTYVGEGPHYEELQSKIQAFGLSDKVRLLGYMSEPYEIISESDIMILPSLSEGVSRASLESLFLGLPCVMRDVDGNRELISDKYRNGKLFSQENELTDAILKAIDISINRTEKNSLLPVSFTQDNVIKLLKKHLE